MRTFITTPLDRIQRFETGGAMDIISSVIGGLIQATDETVNLLLQAEEKLPGSLELIYSAISTMSELGSQEATKAKEIMEQDELIANTLLINKIQKNLNGAKLAYIKQLQGYVPEGYQKIYFKCGGKVYSKVVKKDKCGSKMKKCEKGNNLPQLPDSTLNMLNNRAAERLKLQENNNPSKIQTLLGKRAAERLNGLNNSLEPQNKKRVFDPTYKRFVTKEKCGGKTKKKC